MTITTFTYGTSVSPTVTITSETGLSIGSALTTCYYSAPDVNITSVNFVDLLTKVLPVNLTTGSAVSLMGTTMRTNITVANLITKINLMSELDKRWSSSSVVSDTFWTDFFTAIGNVDIDFTSTPIATGDKIQFIFKFDAPISPIPTTITPSSTEIVAGVTVQRFLVGQTFVVA